MMEIWHFCPKPLRTSSQEAQAYFLLLIQLATLFPDPPRTGKVLITAVCCVHDGSTVLQNTEVEE